MTTELSNQVTIEVGDTGGDGHDRTRRLVFKTNLPSHEMMKAYFLGVATLGFDFINTVGVEYEDSTVTPEQGEMLRKAGCDWSVDRENISYDEFIDVYLFIVKLGNPSFEWKQTRTDVVDIGGYGLV